MTTNPNTGRYDEDFPPRTGATEEPLGETVLGDATVTPAVPVETVPPARTTTTTSTTSTAKEEAKDVGREGMAAGQRVAGVAREEAGNVAQEAKFQVKNLVSQVGDNVRGQAGAQQQKAASGLRSFSDGLTSMANGSPQSGAAMNLVNQAAERVNGIADWLENRDPSDLLEEVRSFARRRPGAFLAIAAGAGLLAGRLTRGMTAGAGGGTAATRRMVDTTGAVPPQPTYVPETTGTDGTTGTGAYGTTGTGAYGTTGAGAYGTEPDAGMPPVPSAGSETTSLPPRTPSEQTLDEGGERG
ncbi:hypothetical protein ACFQ36_18300 [Arthrobacter sp. GCM10027362]|uniref:hypothetical protein n=1 Tax=Arthrobacter sp. GCM10027362 TaxID=3273379 RepID=UPI003634E532